MTDSTPSNAPAVPAATELAENRPNSLRQRAETVPFVDVTRPLAGGVATVDVQPGHALKLNFELAEITARKVEGENLELSFGDGGKLVLRQYLQLAEDDVAVVRKDGTTTDFNALVLPQAALPETQPDEPVSGGHFYSQYDPGGLGDGIDHLGGLGDDDISLRGGDPENTVLPIDLPLNPPPLNTPPLNTPPLNTPPVALDDATTTAEDTAVTIAVLPNDSDPNGDDVRVVSAGNGARGTTSVATDGSIVYTPNANAFGTDSFVYTITDGNGGTASATVAVTINGINDPPVALNDTGTTDEDTAITLNVLANDSDVDGGPLTVIGAGNGAHGSTGVANDGSIVYTPNADFSGTDSFVYTITDGNGGTASATATVTVRGVNDPPLAADDFASTSEDNAVVVNVLGNDTDIDGGPLTVTSAGNGVGGTVSVGAGGNITYTPNANFFGTDSFVYTITDGNGGTASATVHVTVSPVNDPPVAADDTATTNEDTAVTVSVLSNDSDIDGGPLTVVAAGNGANGTTSVGPGGEIAYTPNAEFSGTDSFVYTITDGNGGTASATVVVTVAGVNDPPVAADDTATTNEDTAVTVSVLSNDSDIDGGPLTVVAAGNGANGTTSVGPGGEIAYTPNAEFSGTDSFVYTITDGNGGTSSALVTVTVLGINDPPLANDDAASTNEDNAVSVNVLGNDTDVDGGALTVIGAGNGLFGSTGIGSDGTIVYTPIADFSGTDFFVYTISDGNGGTASATVTVTVQGVNDPPIARDDDTVTGEDFPVTVGVLGNDTDVDGAGLTVATAGNGAHGTTTITTDGAVLYTPDTDFNGTDSFVYTISDGNGGTASATATVTVLGLNDNPVANIDSATTDEDVAVTVDVRANDTDVDNDPLTVLSWGDGANGSVALGTDGQLVYTPAADFVGTDSFTYTIVDGNGGGDSTTVFVTVLGVNDRPLASDDNAATGEEIPVTVNVLGNDSDVDGAGLTVTSAGNGAHGTTSIATDGTVVYTPETNFFGTDSFVYAITDGNGGTASATVIVTVIGIQDPPLANDDHFTTNEDQTLPIDRTELLGNDTDPDGDLLNLVAVGTAQHGTVTLAGPSAFYTPDLDFSGTDSFTYTVTDGQGGTASATAYITVAPVNDPPLAGDDSVTTAEDVPLTLSGSQLTANDFDLDGDPLTVIGVGNASSGSVSLGTDGQIVYTPAADFSGTDSFFYTISDGQGGTRVATVNVSVTPVNDAPVANDDTDTLTEDNAAFIFPTNNDTDPDGNPLTIVGAGNGAHGTVTITTGGFLQYTPDPDFSGTDAFVYTITDGNGGTASATVTITVNGVNDAPLAGDDTASTAEDLPITVDVLANDSDIDGDTPTVLSVGNGAGGTTSVGTDGQIVYTPNPGFSGTDSFVYTITDGNGGTASASVSVAVDGLARAVDDFFTGSEGASLNGNVFGNDSAPDGLAGISLGTAPLHGSVSLQTDGSFTYTPDQDYLSLPVFRTGDIQANSTTANFQGNQRVAALPDGGFIAVWTGQQDAGQTGADAFGIYGQRFDAQGNAVGPELQIDSVLPGHDAVPDVTVLADGGFVVVWSHELEVWGRVFEADGTPRTAEFVVDGSPFSNDWPAVQALAGGGFAVVWDDQVSSSTNDRDIGFRLFDSNGNPTTAATTANIVNAGWPVQFIPTIVELGNGNIVVAWTGRNQDAVNSDGVYGRIFAPDGTPLTGEIPLNTTVASEQFSPALAPLAGGGFVATWTGAQENGTGPNGVYGQLFDNDGNKVGAEFHVNSTIPGNQSGADVVGLPNGGFVVFWHTASLSADPSTYDVYAQVYDAGGIRVGGELLINDNVTGAQAGPAATVLDNGDVVISWGGEGPGGGNQDIYFRILTAHEPDQFTYTITDADGDTASATVYLDVLGTPDAPVAVDDSATVQEGSLTTVAVLPNDTDIDGDQVTLIGVGNGAHGSTVMLTDGTIRYTPQTNFAGTDSFVYTITDGNGGTATATATITVVGVNDDPDAVFDQATTDEDSPVTLAVLGNDTDVDGDTLTVIGVGTTDAGGTVTINPDGTITYTPPAGFNGGFDFFSYDITDGNGGGDSAIVVITIDGVNDAPLAGDDEATTDENVAVTIDVLANDTDDDFDALTILAVENGSGGTTTLVGGQIVYTPDPDYEGVDTFVYTIDDGNGGTATATVTVGINGVNVGPLAIDDDVSTDANTPIGIDVLGNDTDPDNDALEFVTWTSGNNGGVAYESGQLIYAPNADFEGTDSFTYTITDGNGGTASAVVIVTVNGVNDAPLAGDDNAATDVDVPVTVNVLANDSDPDSDTLSVVGADNGANGTATVGTDGQVTYTPDNGFVGTDSFTYTISDGNGATALGTVLVTVDGALGPLVAEDDGFTVNENHGGESHSLTGNLGSNDTIMSGPAFFGIIDGFLNGSLDFHTDGTFAYTPYTDYEGVESFTYLVADYEGHTASAVATITVLGVNLPPDTESDFANVALNTPTVVDVLDNDGDFDDNDMLTVIGAGAGAHGQGSVTTDGVVIYTPNDGYTGVDNFLYTVSDGNGGMATESVLVYVTQDGVNNAPVAADDYAFVRPDTAQYLLPLGGDFDINGDTLTLIGVSNAGVGTLEIDGDYVRYEPNPAYEGTDSFIYTISDGNGGMATASFLISLAYVNTPPVANDDDSNGEGSHIPIESNVAREIVVLDNDYDDNSDPLTLIGFEDPAHGTVVQTTSGSFVYLSDFNYNGIDQFAYTISDGNGGSASALVVIDVYGGETPQPSTDDFLVDLYGYDFLAGDLGVDTMLGLGGPDTFFVGAMGPTNYDRILDFKPGEGDSLDITSLITDWVTPGTLDNFVQFVEHDGNTDVMVSSDGSPDHFQKAAELIGVTGLNALDLMQDNTLLVPHL